LFLPVLFLGWPLRAANLFVATNGNDAWTGRLPEPNAPGTDGPFATLERARDAVRALKLAGPPPLGGIAVQVRAGVYALTNSLRLTPADSGTESAPVIYRNFGREKVILSGGKAITGFAPYRGQILKADVGAQGFKAIYFR
jgi:hypothetical protein